MSTEDQKRGNGKRGSMGFKMRSHGIEDIFALYQAPIDNSCKPGSYLKFSLS